MCVIKLEPPPRRCKGGIENFSNIAAPNGAPPFPAPQPQGEGGSSEAPPRAAKASGVGVSWCSTLARSCLGGLARAASKQCLAARGFPPCAPLQRKNPAPAMQGRGCEFFQILRHQTGLRLFQRLKAENSSQRQARRLSYSTAWFNIQQPTGGKDHGLRTSEPPEGGTPNRSSDSKDSRPKVST